MWSLARFAPADGFSIGLWHIYYYSLLLLAALWVGYLLAVREARKRELRSEIVTDLIAIALVTGVIGGRLGFILQNIGYFSNHLGDIWRLTTGGLSIHGAIVAASIAVALYARRQKLNFFRLSDTFVLPLLAGQIIGRFGNYFNQELFGYPTDAPWKILIDPAHRPAGYYTESFYHPTFIYEIILNLVGLVVLSRLQYKKEGQRTTAYLILFFVVRFIVEIWRISDRLILGLSLAQLISLLGIVAIAGLAARYNIFKKE